MLLGVKQGIYKEEEYGYLFADIMRKQSDTALWIITQKGVERQRTRNMRIQTGETASWPKSDVFTDDYNSSNNEWK